MGCGSSSSSVEKTNETLPAPIQETQEKDDDGDSETGSDELKEPEVDPLPLDDILPEYPPPLPSTRMKKAIFTKEKFEKVDDHARWAPVEAGNSFDGLVSYLTQGLYTDIEKVRSLFVWIGSQNTRKEGPNDSPHQIMSMVRDKTISYSYLFTRLCRTAGIPCVNIKGLAKSVAYDVGDNVDKIQKLNNKWNAVYVDGEWRLVFVRWAFSAVAGYSTGKYTLMETQGKTVGKKLDASSGTDISRFNDFYFFTDPEEFVYIAIASDPAWQLLQDPFTIDKFASVPYLRQAYFTHSIKLKSEFSSRLHSHNGETSIVFHAEDVKWDGYLSYELFYNDEESESPQPGHSQLGRFVFMERQIGKWNFQVRYPSKGVYQLTINIGKGRSEHWLCHFKLYCENVVNDVKPLPCNPGPAGWGPSIATEFGGLTSPSQKIGNVIIKSTKIIVFKFILIKQVIVRSELVHNDITSVTLQQYVEQTVQSEKLQVSVRVPQDGEYALRLYSKVKNVETNVCNYLVTSSSNTVRKNPRRENVTERNVRSTLHNVTEGTNLKILTEAIEKFQKYKLQDKGDLQKAKDKQEYLSLLKELKEAINRRHVDPLNKAIHRATNSQHEAELRDYITIAEETRDGLLKLGIHKHDIMDMKQSTVSEVNRYVTPQSMIEDIMTATYLLLGESAHKLKNWYYLQLLMKTIGRESLLSRIRSVDIYNVPEDTVNQVSGLLSKYDEDRVRLTSPAAGTFYRWATGVLKEIRNTRHANANLQAHI